MTSNIENLSLKYEDIVGSKENVIGSKFLGYAAPAGYPLHLNLLFHLNLNSFSS